MKSEAMEFKSEEEEDDKGKDSALFGCPPATTEAAVIGIADSNSCGGKRKWRENEKLEQCSNSRKKL